jgi:hypothetical protein
VAAAGRRPGPARELGGRRWLRRRIPPTPTRRSRLWWAAQGKAQRLKAEAELRQATSKTTLTGQQIQNLIEECADIASDLRDGDPGELAGAYRKLGLRLTYHPERHLVSAAACPKGRNYRQMVSVRGGT